MSTSLAMDKPLAIDLSHHLSTLAKSRVPSPLKGMYKYFTRPGILMLAGGLPPPAYFPYESIECTTLKPNSFKTTQPGYVQAVWNWIKGVETDRWTISKWDADKQKVQLSTALQYGTAAGLFPLAQFIHEFVDKVYGPAYADFHCVINAGSTDAWGKIVTTLCEPGDGVLCEEWTYPSALATAWPTGMKPVPLPMDGGGLTVEGMDHLLATWDPAEHDGMRRPRILYTVPVCQNPTGATMTYERKKQIYELAVKYDVIIVEDDPYYFLQAPPYVPRSARASSSATKSATETDKEFLESLVPSYLRCDTQGRVVRIDTFSKTICPGSRLGFTVCNPVFGERLEKANESSTQSASGFAQALVGKLLAEEWKFEGYLRWLKGLKAQYRDRRDCLVDLLVSSCDAGLDPRQAGQNSWELVLRDASHATGRIKTIDLDEKGKDRGTKVLSFVAPQGGMFVWLRIHFASHPSFNVVPTSTLLWSLWEDLAEHNVLVAPGSMFSGRVFPPKIPTNEVEDGGTEMATMTDWNDAVDHKTGDGFFRIAFSTATEDQMREATKIIGKRVERFFRKE
ncbi:hypothetical protein JCM10212_001079 [Sporobolomyces blumeae]